MRLAIGGIVGAGTGLNTLERVAATHGGHLSTARGHLLAALPELAHERVLRLFESAQLAAELSRFQRQQRGGVPPAANDGAAQPQARGATLGSAQFWEEVQRIFARHALERGGTIGASSLREALGALGLVTDGEQAAAILRRYDEDASHTLDAHEFRKLVAQLRRFVGHALGMPAARVVLVNRGRLPPVTLDDDEASLRESRVSARDGLVVAQTATGPP